MMMAEFLAFVLEQRMFCILAKVEKGDRGQKRPVGNALSFQDAGQRGKIENLLFFYQPPSEKKLKNVA